MNVAATAASPDSHASGLLDVQPEALRYDWSDEFGPDDVGEVPDIVRQWIPERSRLLDVGCSAGAISLKVTKGKQVQFLGVEPDAQRAEAARARGLEVVNGYLDERLLLERGPFDVIMFTDVLEHVEAPGAILRLAARGLAEGGVIIASVPNVAHWTVRTKLMFGRFDYAPSGIMDATHLRWFTAKTFRGVFERSGFQVLEMGASAGTWMGEYNKFPFKLVPLLVRRKAVRILARGMPRLFGCQLVAKAIRGGEPAFG
jgi:methionine biosynthesis protein MetW